MVQMGIRVRQSIPQRHLWCCAQLKSDRNSCVKNKKESLREKLKPCTRSHLSTPDQLLQMEMGVLVGFGKSDLAPQF